MQAAEHTVEPSDRGRELPSGERLGELLQSLEPRLTALALRFTRDPEAARDVVQNAFEKVVRYGESFDGRARASTWIHRIVTNEALMWLRSERRRARYRGDFEDCENAVVDSAPDPAATLEQRCGDARLRAGIARLDPPERDVVISCALSGCSYAEFGRQRGLHPAAVKSRAYRARQRLRELLSEGPRGGMAKSAPRARPRCDTRFFSCSDSSAIVRPLSPTSKTGS